MTQRVVIVGGGTGGTMVANRLARRLRARIRRGEVRLVLLTDTPEHVYQPGFLSVALEGPPAAAYSRPLQSLLLPGVELHVDPAAFIDPAAGVVKGVSGRSYPFDFLVLATGSYPDLTSLPGLAEGGHDFYTARGAERLHRALQQLEKGRIVLTVDVPHKCPVAPVELMLMLDDRLRRAGRRKDFELVYTYPIGRVQALPPIAEWAAEQFEQRGIEAVTFFNPERVEPAQRRLYSLEGEELDYDLLIAIPAHRGAGVIRESGLGDELGFLPTDRVTLQLEGYENVYVVGDASALPVSKAGSTAHYQADVVAGNLADRLEGHTPGHRYDGKVFCFIEAGSGPGLNGAAGGAGAGAGAEAATYVSFSYARPPQPATPTPMLHWFKLAYNELYWLSVRGLL